MLSFLYLIFVHNRTFQPLVLADCKKHALKRTNIQTLALFEEKNQSYVSSISQNHRLTGHRIYRNDNVWLEVLVVRLLTFANNSCNNCLWNEILLMTVEAIQELYLRVFIIVDATSLISNVPGIILQNFPA